MIMTITSTTKDVGEQLSHQYALQKANNLEALHQILRCILLLCRQGLPLRSDKEEVDGNLKQLLKFKAESDANLASWLARKENIYTSPDIQNEIIKLMGVAVLRNVVSSLQSSPFLTIMIDETTDISNQEQVTLFLRWVSDTLELHEEFLGISCSNY